MTRPDMEGITKRAELAKDLCKRLSVPGEPDGFDYYALDVPALLAYIAEIEAVVDVARTHRKECSRIRELIGKIRFGPKNIQFAAVKEREEKGNHIGVTAQALDDALAKLDGEK